MDSFVKTSKKDCLFACSEVVRTLWQVKFVASSFQKNDATLLVFHHLAAADPQSCLAVDACKDKQFVTRSPSVR